MKRIIILALLVGSVIAVSGQDQYKNEFSISVGGGISTLNYKTSIGDYQAGFGGNTGLGYALFVNPNWGLRTAIEFGLYNASTKLSKLSDRYMTNDGEYDFEFRSNFLNYEEKQRMVLLNIPIMVQYQTSGKDKYYVAFGGRIGIPINQSYTTSPNQFKTTGYYAQWNVEHDMPAFMGFGTFEVPEKKNELDLKLSYMLSLETGVKWALKKSLGLYTGVYFDYGINNLLKTSSKEKFLEYNAKNPSDFRNNSVLVSEYRENGNINSFVKKVNPMTIGIKLRLTFGSGKNLSAEKDTLLSQIEEEARRIAREAEEIMRLAEEAKEAKRIAEEERLKAEQEAAEARRKADEEAKRLAEMEANMRKLDSLLAKANEIKNAAVEKVIGENNLEAVKVEFNSNILFAIGRSELTQSSRESLDGLVNMLKESPETNIDIFGHTDNTASLELNQQLSQDRAHAVANYLVSKGVSLYQIRNIVGKNYSEPIADNETTEGRSKNRRVEIYMYVNRK